MMYLASSVEVAPRESSELSVEPVEPERDAVRQWFGLPYVRYVGAHTGCSCGFPSVVADQPVDWYDGMFAENKERTQDLASVRALFELVGELLSETTAVELLPVWTGDEFEPPAGTVRIVSSDIQPDRFVFTQHFMYRVER
jgi:hypothetical protein